MLHDDTTAARLRGCVCLLAAAFAPLYLVCGTAISAVIPEANPATAAAAQAQPRYPKADTLHPTL